MCGGSQQLPSDIFQRKRAAFGSERYEPTGPGSPQGRRLPLQFLLLILWFSWGPHEENHLQSYWVRALS